MFKELESIVTEIIVEFMSRKTNKDMFNKIIGSFFKIKTKSIQNTMELINIKMDRLNTQVIKHKVSL